MTDEELVRMVDEVSRLIADNERLRALVKAAGACGHCCAHCAFCSAGVADGRYNYDSGVIAHHDNCPAFTPDGAVR